MNNLCNKRGYRQRHPLGLFLLPLMSLCALLFVLGFLTLSQLAHGQSLRYRQNAAGTNQVKQSTRSNSMGANPFINVIPDANGRELYVNIYGYDRNTEAIFINGDEGPTGRQYSYTATYSDTLDLHHATLIGFTPGTDVQIRLQLTGTAGLATLPQEYPRFFIAAGEKRTLALSDGRLELTTVNTATFPNDTYLVLNPGFIPDGVVEAGYRVINQPYTLNGSGSITGTNEAMLLKMRYTQAELQGAAPASLALMQWQSAAQAWIPLPSVLFEEQQELVTSIHRFATYALMVTPSWRDDFDDLSGLDLQSLQNVDLKPKNGAVELLVLAGNATTGVAHSTVITPPVAIQQWDKLTYRTETSAPTTTVAIDLLDSTGNLILADLANGQSLATVDPIRYPSLRLRVRFTSTIAGASPSLDEWSLSWQPSAPAPSATPTGAATPIVTPTVTSTVTSPVTATVTVTPAATPAATLTPTATPMITASITPTAAPSVTPLATPPVTPTAAAALHLIYLPEIKR